MADQSQFNASKELDKIQVAFARLGNSEKISETIKVFNEVAGILTDIHEAGKKEGFLEGYKKGHVEGSKIDLKV